MTTLTPLRTELRTELKDTDATAYKWTDSELDRHIRRALVEYSRASPREMKTARATTSGSRDIDLSAMSGIDDLVKVLAVEFPTGSFPRAYQRFAYYNKVVTMLGGEIGDGTNANIYWGSVHLLAEVGDPTCTVPEKDHETVLCGAAGYAAVAWATYAINRTNLGDVPRQYFNWGNERLKRFGEDLRRLRSRVRTQRMYPPAIDGAQSQTTDWGP